MRLHIKTTPNTTPIPMDYQPKMVGVIHKWLGENNDDHGKISLYSFSLLQGTTITNNAFNCSRGAKFFISFYDVQKAKIVLKSILDDPEMFAGLIVTDVTIEDEPDLNDRELFYFASPILVKKSDGDEKKIQRVYLQQ